jgi:hypothetical protein
VFQLFEPVSWHRMDLWLAPSREGAFGPHGLLRRKAHVRGRPVRWSSLRRRVWVDRSTREAFGSMDSAPENPGRVPTMHAYNWNILSR